MQKVKSDASLAFGHWICIPLPFFKDNTVMLLGDAKATLEAIKTELA